MLFFSGKSVYKGIALGPVAVLKPQDQQVKRTKVQDADAEIFRLGRAGEQARQQFVVLYEKAVRKFGKPVPRFLSLEAIRAGSRFQGQVIRR